MYQFYKTKPDRFSFKILLLHFTLAYACEHKAGYTMVCPSAYYITILYAMYGRLEQEICGNIQVPESGCQAVDSLQKAQNYTNSKCGTMPSTCSIEAHNAIFGDPCFGTVKYLHLLYSCFPRLITSSIFLIFNI